MHNKSLPVPQEVISLNPAYIEISTTDTGIEFDGIVKCQSRGNNNNILVPLRVYDGDTIRVQDPSDRSNKGGILDRK